MNLNLNLEPEDGNEYDKNVAVAIIDGKADGHIPKNLSKNFKRFLTLPNCTIKCTVIGKRVNHGTREFSNLLDQPKQFSE